MCNRNAETGLAAFLLGAVTGIALGVLFAPAKGETTRRKLKRWANDTYEEQKDFVLEHAEDAKKKFLEHAENAREKFTEGKDKLVKEFNKRKDEVVAKFRKED
ncbi:MAG: YtxH domain-containing protein [Elusimicrobiaceae bacterium]|nr:YtxH domain-containing protein [Elusimicrobiaceae bacterium]